MPRLIRDAMVPNQSPANDSESGSGKVNAQEIDSGRETDSKVDDAFQDEQSSPHIFRLGETREMSLKSLKRKRSWDGGRKGSGKKRK